MVRRWALLAALAAAVGYAWFRHWRWVREFDDQELIP